MIDLRIVGVPEHSNLPFRWLVEDGLDRASNVNLVWEDVAAGTGEMVRMLRENEADVGVLLTEGAIAAALNGKGTRIVSVWSPAPLRWGVHVRAESPLKHGDDLSGCVFGRSRAGSGSHLMALVGAVERGWAPDRMTFEDVGDLEGARAALREGSSEVFLWERFTTKPVCDQGEWRCIDVWPTPWPSFVLAVSEGVDRAVVLPAIERLVPALRDECARMSAETSVGEVARRYGQQPADVRAWLSGMIWDPGSALSLETIRSTAASLKMAGVIEEFDEGVLDVLIAGPTSDL
jgi:hypothetical protein